jgi:hypothetical protein
MDGIRDEPIIDEQDARKPELGGSGWTQFCKSPTEIYFWQAWEN